MIYRVPTHYAIFCDAYAIGWSTGIKSVWNEYWGNHSVHNFYSTPKSKAKTTARYTIDKSQLLKRLDKAWEAFQASYAGLSEAELIEPGVTGDWSVRDIIAHVTWWEEEALRYLPLILQGGKPPRYSVTYGGIDSFNAQMTELKQHLSLSEVQQQQAATHRLLLEFIQSAPDDQFSHETRFRHRLRLDTYSHYPEHAEEVRKWREQRSTVDR